MLAENSSDEYSDENYDNDFDEDDDKEADKKLQNLRKAMQRENVTAAKVVSKHGIKVQKEDARPVLKMGPSTGKGTATME